jgi:chromosome segregation ATPase
MNTQQIEQTQSNVLPLGEAITQLVNAFNADAVEQDDIIESLEKSEQENTFLKMQLSNITKRLDVALGDVDNLTEVIDGYKAKEKDFDKKAEQVTKNANQHMEMLDQALREKTQMEVKLDNAMLTIASYKELGTPKKLREQRKSYQERITKLQGIEKQLKLDAKKYRHEITVATKYSAELTQRLSEVDITEIYSENGDNLYLFPKTKQITSRGLNDKKIVMLYLNNDGRGGLMSIDEDGEITLGKGTIRPKAATIAHSGKFLRKWNKAGHVQADDLRIFGEVA